MLAFIHAEMQMSGFEIQPLSVKLGYFNVVSVLGIILCTAPQKKKKKLCMNGSALKVAPTAFNGLPNQIRPMAALSPNPLRSDGA